MHHCAKMLSFSFFLFLPAKKWEKQADEWILFSQLPACCKCNDLKRNYHTERAYFKKNESSCCSSISQCYPIKQSGILGYRVMCSTNTTNLPDYLTSYQLKTHPNELILNIQHTERTFFCYATKARLSSHLFKTKALNIETKALDIHS